MSKKSRKRNKRILGALLLGGLGLGLANRQKGIATGVSGSDKAKFTLDSAPKKKVVSTPVSTKTTIMDSMPARPKLNEKSIRVKDGKVFTIADAKKGIKPKISGIDTPGISINEKGNITAGGKQFYDKNQYRTRNDKPGMLGDSGFTAPRTYNDISPFAAKNGGRAKLKSGGKVKGCGKALRGYGRAMKGKK